MSISNLTPAFRILSMHGFFGPDDHLYNEGEEIYFDGEPNEEMEPLNELGRQKLTAYLEKLDTLAKEVATKTGRPFSGRPRNLEGAIQLATEVERSKVVVMGHLNKDRTTSDYIERVDGDNVPETGSINPKRGRGRPAGSKNKPSLAV